MSMVINCDSDTVMIAIFISIQKFIMIDLIQWRVCIGMWCGHMKSVKKKSRLDNNMQRYPGVQWIKDYPWESKTLGMCTNILRALFSLTSVWLYTLTVCIFLLLILSGDVESNPGPVG